MKTLQWCLMDDYPLQWEKQYEARVNYTIILIEQQFSVSTEFAHILASTPCGLYRVSQHAYMFMRDWKTTI